MRETCQLGTGVAPNPWLLDTTVQKGVASIADPTTLNGVNLVDGDVWFSAGGASAPLTGAAGIIANAGVRPGTLLTSYTQTSGNMIVDKNAGVKPSIVSSGAGTDADPWIVRNYDINLPSGYIQRRSGVIRFINCNIHSSYQPAVGTTTPFAIVLSTGNIQPAWDQVVLDHCTLSMDRPHSVSNGMMGHSITALNCDIFHVGDGGGPQAPMSGGVVTFPQCYWKWDGVYVHDHSYFMGAYAPASPDYTSLSNGSIVVNVGGDYNKPDGGHNDGIQPQGGSFGIITNCVLDDFNDNTTDASGVTPWMRKSQNDLTTAAGNGYSVYGALSTSASIQFNQNQSGAPTTDWSVTNNFFRGGRFAVINFAYGPYARMTLQNNTWLEGVAGSGLLGGATIPPWTTTGPGGFNSDGSPKIGTMAASWSPGYAISLGTSGSTTMDLANFANGGNVDFLGNPIPWRNVSSTVIRTG